MDAITNHRTTLTAIVSALAECLLVISCTAGQQQLAVDQQPLAVVDAKSDATIDRVLIIPKYSSSKGVSSASGHGPGYMTHSSFLAFPFVYQTGTAFTLTQPDSNGLLIGRPGDLFVGHAVTIQGAILVAPTYQPLWMWQLWDRSPSTKISLEPLSESEVSEQSQRLQALFGSSQIRGTDLTDSERLIFSTTEDTSMDVRFSSFDRQMVTNFLARQ